MGSTALGSLSHAEWPVAHFYKHPPLWNFCPPCRSRRLTYCFSLIFLWATVHFHPNSPYTDWIWTAVLPPWDTQTLILLHALLHDELPTYTRVWSTELGKELLSVDWRTSFHFTHIYHLLLFSRKKNFKVLSQWYRDPSKLHKMFPSTPDTWQCGFVEGTYLHIWWESGRIRPFWSQFFMFTIGYMMSSWPLLWTLLYYASSSQQHDNSYLCFERLMLHPPHNLYGLPE